MPTNYSQNKVRVTRLFGAGATVGWIDPKVGMVTQQGTVTAIASSGQSILVSVSGDGVGLVTQYYAHQLLVHQSQATGLFSYPTGDGSVAFGRNGVWANGVPVIPGTGMYYKEGGMDRPGSDGVTEFSRP